MRPRGLPRELPLGRHLPGDGPLHRLPAVAGLLGVVLIVGPAAVLVRDPVSAGAYACLCAGLYAVGRIPPRVAAAQAAAPAPLILALAAVHGWQRGPGAGLALGVMLLCSVLIAALFTLTTTIGELLAGLDRALAPLRRRGVDVDRLSLAVALTLRLVPLQLRTVEEVLEARAARGAGASPRALAVPLLVRSLRRAFGIAEALVARGALDGPPDTAPGDGSARG